MEDMTRSYEKDNQDLLLLVAILMRYLGAEEWFIPDQEVLATLEKQYLFQAVRDYERGGMNIRIFTKEDKNDNV